MKNNEIFWGREKRRRLLLLSIRSDNRRILEEALADEYELYYSENKEEALRLLKAGKDMFSLCITEDEDELPGLIKGLPVIVIVNDRSREADLLALGVEDLLEKPLKTRSIILDHIEKAIMRYEASKIIHETQYDPLSGLYNLHYFYTYGQRMDQFYPEVQMDAIVFNVSRFHMINERFGRYYGDRVLVKIAETLKQIFNDQGCIIARAESDSFMVCCPHRDDHKAILQKLDEALKKERVMMRMGVYACADKDLPIETRFDRARQAAMAIRNDYQRRIGTYDKRMSKQELFNQRLIDDFETALAQEQFKVFYQPKFNIRSDIPVLTSAEALLRWKHPSLGLIPPNVFIPLFEENGLISRLDLYVWQRAARQLRKWREELKIAVPVSVNVSRIDMFDPQLIDDLQDIINDNKLQAGDMLLEITESAYGEDPKLLIDRVNALRKLGFMIEMDDFGTGYSTLNMLSSLPIDALKIDMRFVKEAFAGRKKDTRMIEIIIDIARYLRLLTIAEGVEDVQQLNTLKELGCDIVQGYYFSKPVDENSFAGFLDEKLKMLG